MELRAQFTGDIAPVKVDKVLFWLLHHGALFVYHDRLGRAYYTTDKKRANLLGDPIRETVIERAAMISQTMHRRRLL